MISCQNRQNGNIGFKQDGQGKQDKERMKDEDEG
jgi:hypothetical protein